MNSTIKTKAKDLNRHVSKQDIKWPKGKWKGAQHHESLEKCKLNCHEMSPRAVYNSYHQKDKINKLNVHQQMNG